MGTSTTYSMCVCVWWGRFALKILVILVAPITIYSLVHHPLSVGFELGIAHNYIQQPSQTNLISTSLLPNKFTPI